jgi:DNA-directed RNA polymerase specialized sigma24 family protein
LVLEISPKVDLLLLDVVTWLVVIGDKEITDSLQAYRDAYEAHVVGDEAAPDADSVSDQTPRVARPDAEAVALESYLQTGSIKEAAQAAGVTVNTLKKWHQRRGWKALRDAKLNGAE